MKPSLLFNPEMLDVVFEGRNKEYGAYQMRSTYQERMMRAMIWSFGLFIAMFIAYGVWKNSKSLNEEIAIPDPIVVLREVSIEKPNIKPAEIKPAPAVGSAAPAPPKAQIRYVQPTVVADHQEVETVDIPTQEDLEGKAIGTTTSANESGDANTAFGSDDNTSEGNGTGTGTGTEGSGESEVMTPEVFNFVEEMPEFPGGEKKMMEFIQKKLAIPPVVREMSENQTVHVRFVVDEQGQVSDIQVLRSTIRLMEQPSIDVVSNMPKWKPGKHNGRPVKVYFTLPIKVQFLK